MASDDVAPNFTDALHALALVLAATPPERHAQLRRAWLASLRDSRGHGLQSSGEFAALLDLDPEA